MVFYLYLQDVADIDGIGYHIGVQITFVAQVGQHALMKTVTKVSKSIEKRAMFSYGWLKLLPPILQLYRGGMYYLVLYTGVPRLERTTGVDTGVPGENHRY